jgi:hypothetical protein
LSGNGELFGCQAGATSALQIDPANLGQKDAGSFRPEQPWPGVQALPDIQIDAPKSTPQYLTKGRKRTKERKKDRKFHRQAIPAETKALLTTYLERNPYPSPAEFDKLVKQHGLPLRTIKNWFSNTRARKDPNRKQSPSSRIRNPY